MAYFRAIRGKKIERYYSHVNMFNCSRELNALRGILNDVPQYSIISSPVNSGKSTLLLEAIKTLKLESPGRSIVNIDLRSRTFRSIEAFSSTIIQELDTWYNMLFKLLPDSMKARSSILSPQIELTFERGKSRPTECLQEVYDALLKALPEWSWLKEENIPSPILCIDEANRLQALLDDERGNVALNDFLAWVVLNTKQMHRFHVVMASSDSFFHRWISQYVDSTCFRNLVVGHLSKEEAKRYVDSILEHVLHYSILHSFTITIDDIRNSSLKFWCCLVSVIQANQGKVIRNMAG